MKRSFLLALSVFFLFSSRAQTITDVNAKKWADSVYKTLSDDQKIAQLMMVRLSGFDGGHNVSFYEDEVAELVNKYNIGGVVLFQGGPLKQAAMINNLQAIAKTPLFISVDAENGVGMRFDSVQGLPRQMMLGAVQDPTVIYQYGKLVGEQCKRMGIQINYAPVVDINNNPDNPVINDRSFGEDKYRVALYGIQYMHGMQELGVIACAKHFPGHGDVSVDSHKDLPEIDKSMKQLDSLELYPFRQIIRAGVKSVMVAHLHVPAIDNAPNRATSISKKNVTGLLRNKLGFKGLTFTDALEMKGVAKYFGPGEVAAQSLIAGNDLLCLPGDIPGSIEKIKEAIQAKKLSWNDINYHVKKVLMAKYMAGLNQVAPVSADNLVSDLNSGSGAMRRLVAENALTLLRNDDAAIFPLAKGRRVAYVGFGLTKDNEFARQIRDNYDAQVYYFDYGMDSSKIAPMLELMKARYDVVIIGLHHLARFPAGNFGISDAALSMIRRLQAQERTITMVFGNPYAVKNVCNSKILVACYEDDSITQATAADLLLGRFVAKGKLPVTVCENFPYGSGIVSTGLLPTARPADVGFTPGKLFGIDSIVNDAISKHSIPGAVVLVAKDGKMVYERSYGFLTYDSTRPVYPETIYDLASMTKIMATTVSLMKLYDEGKFDINKTLGDYLPWTRGTDKAALEIKDIMLHQAGLVAWIPFYRETVDPEHGNGPDPQIYSRRRDSLYSVRVAENMFMRSDWLDTMRLRILQSKLGPVGKYIYSDNDFILLGWIVEAITGMPLEEYVQKTFYEPLGMKTTGFHPRYRFPLTDIAPTEREAGFRQQLIWGDVHDPGSAMFGGMAGHAGLFSDAYDLAVLSQMLLNKGTMHGIRFLKKSTITLFTSYHSYSRRGYGFDKPDKNNRTRKEPYPTASASPLTFGHTGFTGTCFWIDPQYNLIYIFLSNRVNSDDIGLFLRMNVRPKVHELIYQSLQ